MTLEPPTVGLACLPPYQAPAGRSLLNHSSRKDSAGLQALNPAISSSLSHVICLLPECLISRLYLGSAGLTKLASTAFYACLLAMLLLGCCFAFEASPSAERFPSPCRGRGGESKGGGCTDVGFHSPEEEAILTLDLGEEFIHRSFIHLFFHSSFIPILIILM